MRTQTQNINRSMQITRINRNRTSRISTTYTGTNCKAVISNVSPKIIPGGYSLADMIKKYGQLDDKRIISICISILKALSEKTKADSGTFPGNITPSGIIFRDNGKIEFIETEPEITLELKSVVSGKISIINGIPAYMSPECATGLNEGSRFGIYTFGAIMYEMLTGLPPYNGASPNDTLNAVKQGPPRKLVRLNPAINYKLAAICEKCMDRRVNYRYPTLLDVLADFENMQINSSAKNTFQLKGWVCSMLSAFI